MYDINFYMKATKIVEEVTKNGEITSIELQRLFEKYRSQQPIIYNIETTNACNMRCKMCPRTTKMTRDISFVDIDKIEKVIDQISPHSKELWEEWENFCTEKYGISPTSEPSENHFFLHIIPKVIQLHGYGDPLLDKNLGKVISLLKERGFETYFSCNPANIDIEKTIEMMENGLTYLKYSFESTDDFKFKDIRGNAANFTEAFDKTKDILRIIDNNKLKTKIIITMIDVGHDEEQQREYKRLTEAFSNYDVYVYLKSEDQQWYRGDDGLMKYLEERGRVSPSQDRKYYGTNSIHWDEYCKHPWMSMTIKSDGEVHMCMEDYNNEIYLGNAYKDSLYDIWNGELYRKFRENHFLMPNCIKCVKECDMPKVGQLF